MSGWDAALSETAMRQRGSYRAIAHNLPPGGSVDFASNVLYLVSLPTKSSGPLNFRRHRGTNK